MRKKILINGMHCGNCVKNVERALNGIPGVTSVQVNLDDGNAMVEFAGTVSDGSLKDAVEEKGFDVTGIWDV